MTEQEFFQQLQLYKNGVLPAAATQELLAHVADGDYETGIKTDILELLNSNPVSNQWTAEKEQALLTELLDKIKSRQLPVRKIQPRKTISIRRIAVAAAVLLALVTAGYFLLINAKQGKEEPVVFAKTDVDPGSYKARLTLADGRVIILDSAMLGKLAQQGNTSIVNKDGQLVYTADESSSKGQVGPAAVSYNTISTAKGETYSLTLADGSRVWLNSGSSIHFPVAFSGKERRIEVTGEVYVKVAHDKAHPFIASANGMEVLALGTEFNINAYSDEAHTTATLVEGSVKVNASVTLKPGEQTQLLPDGKLTAATPVNMDEVTSWKDGWFHFENADLKTILRQFARWYDVEVVYEGPVKNRKFLTVVKRSSTLQQVLKMLQYNDIVFTIEGKKLVVKAG